jgi:hypothetical protein
LGIGFGAPELEGWLGMPVPLPKTLKRGSCRAFGEGTGILDTRKQAPNPA